MNRRFRAFKALQQLRDDEEFGEYAGPAYYPIFHEAVSLPAVREWLGWDDTTNEFKIEEQRRDFYDLITPSTDDNENEVTSKLRSREQVRQLRIILPKPDARRILLDPHGSFDDALAAAKQDEFSIHWVRDITEAVTALEKLGIDQVKRLDADAMGLLNRLRGLIEERIKDHQALISDKD